MTHFFQPLLSAMNRFCRSSASCRVCAASARAAEAVATASSACCRASKVSLIEKCTKSVQSAVTPAFVSRRAPTMVLAAVLACRTGLTRGVHQHLSPGESVEMFRPNQLPTYI